MARGIGATNLIDVEQQSPEQQEPIGPTGIQVADVLPGDEDPFAFGEKVENAELGRQFGALLQTGKEGMIATANALIEEGSLTQEDLKGLDPNLPAFQSADGQLKWYQGIDKIIKRKETETKRAEISGLKDEEALEKGFREGIDTKDLLAGREKIKRSKRVEQFFDLISKGGSTLAEIPDIATDESDVTVIQSGVDAIQAQIDATTTGGVSDDPDIKAFVKGLERQKKDLKDRIKAIQVESRFTRKEGRILTEAEKKAMEKFSKETKPSRAIQTELADVDQSLKDLGLPDGIETFDPGGVDIPGAGVFGDVFKRFLSTPAGVAFNANAQRLIAEDRHELFGAAFTGPENKAFADIRGGKGLLGNEKQFLAYFRALKRVSDEKIKAVTPRQEKALKKLKGQEKKKDPEEAPQGEIKREGTTKSGVKFRIRKKK